MAFCLAEPKDPLTGPEQDTSGDVWPDTQAGSVR